MYHLRVDAIDAVAVTLMHLVPVDPGARFEALNSAVFELSSVNESEPVFQAEVGLSSVTEYAARVLCRTVNELAINAAATAVTAEALRRVEADIIVVNLRAIGEARRTSGR
jgi:hypothetical protein